MQRWVYRIEVTRARDGWTARVDGAAPVWRRGPFRTPDEAYRAVHGLVRRWQARARALGGFVWLPEGGAVGVALPPGVPVRAGLPFTPAPCSRVPAR